MDGEMEPQSRALAAWARMMWRFGKRIEQNQWAAIRLTASGHLQTNAEKKKGKAKAPTEIQLSCPHASTARGANQYATWERCLRCSLRVSYVPHSEAEIMEKMGHKEKKKIFQALEDDAASNLADANARVQALDDEIERTVQAMATLSYQQSCSHNEMIQGLLGVQRAVSQTTEDAVKREVTSEQD